jgi:glycine dehydrogenase
MSSYTLTNFAIRHIGISSTEINDMLNVIGVDSLDQLIDETVPDSIRMKKHLQLPDALNEYEYLAMLRDISLKNKVYKTLLAKDIMAP